MGVLESRSGHEKTIGKSADQNRITYEGGQKTSACQIVVHVSHVSCHKFPETHNLTSFGESKCSKNMKNEQIVTKI